MTGGNFQWLVLQEVKRLLLMRWVAGATVLLCACSAFSVLLGTRDLQEHSETHQELVQQRVEIQIHGTGRVLGRSAEPGLRVIRSPAPGSVLAVGIEGVLPAAWEFTPAGTEALDPYVRGDAANVRSFGDLAGIIAALGGLLALWLGVSTVVSDRAAGRIAALRALPVAPETLVIIRLLGGTVALVVVTTVWVLTIAVGVRVLVPADVVPHLIPIWMAGPVLSYLALLFAFGTAVGAAAREGLGAFAATFLFWMAIVFVVPQTNQLVTRAVIDVPPKNRMEVERRERNADEFRTLENEIGSAMATQWPAGPFPSDKDQSLAYFAVGEPLWREGVIRIRHLADLEEGQWRDQHARADRINRWLDGLSPSSWLFESLTELAGTGRSTAIAWTEAIEAHSRALNLHLFDDRPKVNARVPWSGDGLVAVAVDRHQAPRYSDLPLFVAPPDQSGTWTSAARRSFAGLLAYTMLAMAAAYFSLRSRLR
jgi:ABC-type transport system involved in multi-copper enzyme maturation permease subunit